ncbi:MAG TPA: PAS domain-containing sensor histidine kinase [Longimicrobium sp.]
MTGPLVLRPAGASPAPWEAALPGAGVLDPGAGELDARALARATSLFADAGAPALLDHVRRVRQVDAALQPVVVAEGAARERIERGLLFARGVGEVWIVAPGEVGPELLERAAEVTRQRRAHRRRQQQVEHALANLEPSPPRRAVLSDAYLAALLSALPDPVLSVDTAGRVISMNPAGERVFGHAQHEVLQRRLHEVVEPVTGTLPDFQRRLGPSESEITFRLPDGALGEGEIVVMPVEAGGHRVYAVVLHDLTEERRIQHELEAAAGELEAQAAELQAQTGALEDALAARARFYWSMSHELRTPVNAIIGYNSLLLDDIYGPLSDEQRAALTRGQRAARHLLELVGDVLDLAKIEAGRIELEPEHARFPELLHDLLVTVQPLAEERGSTISVAGEGNHKVLTDPRRVRQILLNLLSNAVKFGEGEPIEIRWRPEPDGGVAVDVVDRGRGIDAEDLPKLFSEFAQFGERQEGSTGLGLAISRRLADALGGKLTAHSRVGEGSTFCLRLPARLPRGS